MPFLKRYKFMSFLWFLVIFFSWKIIGSYNANEKNRIRTIAYLMEDYCKHEEHLGFHDWLVINGHGYFEPVKNTVNGVEVRIYKSHSWIDCETWVYGSENKKTDNTTAILINTDRKSASVYPHKLMKKSWGESAQIIDRWLAKIITKSRGENEKK